MRMLRGITSVAVGFVLLPMLMRVALAAVLSVWPEPFGAPQAAGAPEQPPAGFMTLNLALAALMAGLSGGVTARLAPEPRFLWVLLLAFVVFAGGLIFGVQQMGGPTPAWYLLGLPLASGIGIAFGGWSYLGWRDRRPDQPDSHTREDTMNEALEHPDIRQLRNDESARRYEAELTDGSVAVVDYRLEGDRILFTHTGTPVELRNRGIAGHLTRHALEDAIHRGLKVEPHCPYTADFIRKHPEYREHLADGFRD